MLSADSVEDGGDMILFVLAAFLSWLVNLGTLRLQSDRDKELEIFLLRRQLAILQRAQPQLPRPSRCQVTTAQPTTLARLRHWRAPAGTRHASVP